VKVAKRVHSYLCAMCALRGQNGKNLCNFV
jgi:hypothetical protein